MNLQKIARFSRINSLDLQQIDRIDQIDWLDFSISLRNSYYYAVENKLSLVNVSDATQK